jgi:hypothetical protein
MGREFAFISVAKGGRTKPLARQWRLRLTVHFLIDGYSLCLGFLA